MLEHGSAFVWCPARYPCWISKFSTYIVVLDIEGYLPTWRAEHETAKRNVGTFRFNMNLFKEITGVYINPSGEVCLDLARPMAESWGGGCTFGSTQAQDDQLQANTSVIAAAALGPYGPGVVAPAAAEPYGAADVGEDVGDSEPLIEDVTPEPAVEAPGSAVAEVLPEDEALKLREFARSKEHLLTHSVSNPYCRGCQSKARNKRHYKGSFLHHRKDKKDKKQIVTMDQVGVADEIGPMRDRMRERSGRS